jgi:predicted RNA binding protein YcfA (HicA-like mRNA interferase family)
MKTRDLRKALKSLGCKLLRQRGSHEVWACPSGRTLPPVVITKREAPRCVIMSIKRVLRDEGLSCNKGWTDL